MALCGAHPGPAHLWLAAVLAGALALASGGCNQDRQRSSPEPGTQLHEAEPFQSPRATFGSAPARGLEILESAEDGRLLVGRRLPVPPQSSARLVFEPVLFDAEGRETPLPALGRLQDARFAAAPSKRVALLDEHDVLWLWDGSSRRAEPIDSEVFPGYDFSHAGEVLLYSKGAGPELDVWRVDLGTLTRWQLTRDQAPVWGFAFSPDDKRVVFVGSQGGYPSLYTMALDGSSLARLTNRGRVEGGQVDEHTLAPYPDGRRPPLWGASAIYLENAAGVHAIDVQGNVLWSVPGAGELHRGRTRGSILLRDGDRYRRVP